MRKKIPKEETFIKYLGWGVCVWGAARKVEIGAIGKHGDFRRIHFSGIPDGGL